MELKFNNEAACENKGDIIRATKNATNIEPTLMDDAEFGVPVKVDMLGANGSLCAHCGAFSGVEVEE